ncbi:MAG: DUF2752 domain-containing protein [Bacteroidales bacterium]|nr:DUF2752 domain-containing protein [Bacteroidales bacterium]
MKITFLLAIPITLWILPADFFDTGKSISIFALFGLQDYAYSTGITRSIMHLMHFDFAGAAGYNKLGFVVLPLLFLLWLKLLLKQFNITILKWF